MARRGVTQTDLSRATKVTQSTISRILRPDGPKGIKSPSDAQVKPLADYFGVTTDQLRGHASIGGALPVREGELDLIGAISPWNNETPLDDDEVFVPLYKEVELAAGNGSTAIQEVTERKIRFALSTLREAGVLPHNAVAATAKGNSMERLIMDGATIGIDRGTTNIIDGEIYAIDHDGMLRVKYLYRMPGGGIRLRSENSEEHPDEIVAPEAVRHIKILGWVFWWSTVRRRRGPSIAK